MATHSAAFAAGLAGAVWAAGHYAGRAASAAVLFLLLALGIKALHLTPKPHGSPRSRTLRPKPRRKKRQIMPWLVLSVAALLAFTVWLVSNYSLAWLPWSVLLGCLTHLAGDAMTERGVPLAWPVSKTMFRLPILGKAGSWRETRLALPTFSISTLALLALHAYHSIHH